MQSVNTPIHSNRVELVLRIITALLCYSIPGLAIFTYLITRFVKSYEPFPRFLRYHAEQGGSAVISCGIIIFLIVLIDLGIKKLNLLSGPFQDLIIIWSLVGGLFGCLIYWIINITLGHLYCYTHQMRPTHLVGKFFISSFKE